MLLWVQKIKPLMLIKSFIGSAFVLGLGFYIGFQSWDSKMYVQVDPTTKYRGLASESKSEDSFYSLTFAEANQKASYKLFKNSKVITSSESSKTINQSENFLGFYLGNFLVPAKQSQGYQFICASYKYMEAHFTALGVRLSGESGLMVVQSPCIENNETWLGPFWIPKKQMLERAGQESFKIEEKDMYIHLYDTSFSLVSEWLLTSVRFFNSEEDEDEDALVVSFNPKEDTPVFKLIKAKP